MSNVTFQRIDDGAWHELRVSVAEHRVSWRPQTKGYAEMEVNSHSDGDWLKFTMREGHNDTKRSNQRETTIKLDRPAAMALQKLLADVFGPLPTT